MNEQITSAAELDAPHYLRMVKCTERSCGTRVRYGELTDDANTHWHIRPGVALVTIPDQPQRVQPSREDVADALIQARSSGMCHFGKVCDLCDCGLEGHTDDEARRADARTLIEADAVLALFAQQPTVAEIARKAWARGYSDAMGDYERSDPLPPNPYGEGGARS